MESREGYGKQRMARKVERGMESIRQGHVKYRGAWKVERGMESREGNPRVETWEEKGKKGLQGVKT